jgi:hypothetical protein
MRTLAASFRPYTWAPPSDEVARLAGIDVSEVLRFDQNTPALPLPSSRARDGAAPSRASTTTRRWLSQACGRAIAEYAGVRARERPSSAPVPTT